MLNSIDTQVALQTGCDRMAGQQILIRHTVELPPFLEAAYPDYGRRPYLYKGLNYISLLCLHPKHCAGCSARELFLEEPYATAVYCQNLQSTPKFQKPHISI